jgi:general L-amino acid transport system substrate-binding protein
MLRPFAWALTLAFASAGMGAAATLSEVQARGELYCGLRAGLAGFAAPDAQEVWRGFDVDMCRALAAAVLGSPDAATVVPIAADTRFAALVAGEVDIVMRNVSWTFARDAALGVDFVGIHYYDGQGFLARRALGVASARELDGVAICVQPGAATQANLDKYMAANGMRPVAVPVQDDEEAQQRLLAGDCDVYTGDASTLASLRATFEIPDDYVILPEIISKEPLGPVVRHGDDQWADIARWTLFALIAAEELGITSANVGEMAATPTQNPEINRLLGTEGDYGAMIGLDARWAVRAIQAGGNYGEIFERNIGQGTPIALTRGLNAQWTQGGLLYAPPFR